MNIHGRNMAAAAADMLPMFKVHFERNLKCGSNLPNANNINMRFFSKGANFSMRNYCPFFNVVCTHKQNT